jgi:hypothetical protein
MRADRDHPVRWGEQEQRKRHAETYPHGPG